MIMLTCVECDRDTLTAYEWREPSGVVDLVCPRCYGDRDSMPEWTPWPDGIIRKPNADQKRAVAAHRFHDTPNAICNACAWQSSI